MQIRQKLEQSRLCYSQELYSEGLELLNSCIELIPDDPLFLFEQACFFYNLGDIDKAKLSLLKSISIHPNSRNHGILATIFADTASPNEAAYHHEKAFKFNNKATFSAYGLAMNGDYEPGGEIYQLIHKCSKKLGQTARDYARLNFALGQIHLKRSENTRALEFFHIGNKYCQEYSPFITEVENKKINDIVEVFLKQKSIHSNQEVVEKSTQETPRLAFIVGLHRSGSTLLEQMLNSHSTINGMGETHNVSRAMAFLAKARGQNQFSTEDVLLTEKTTWQDCGSFLKSIIPETSAQVVVDKQLFNYLFIGCIMAMNPSSLFIDIRRNPSDIFRSCYMTLFSEWPNFSHTPENFVTAYRNYRKLMKLWKELYPSNIVTIYYEKLVENPEKQLTKILQGFGLEYETQCLEFYNNKNSVMTASQLQVRKPIYKSSVGAWDHFKKDFPQADILLKPIIEEYELEINKHV